MAAWLLALIFLGSIVWWAVFKKERAHLPPAPPGWRPLLGHMPLLGALPHQALAELARQHGPKLMSVRLGSMLAIVASTPDAARSLLQTHDQSCAGRPRTAAFVHLSVWNTRNIATSPPDVYWRRMRQICSADLFSNKRIHSFRAVRSKGVRSLLCAVFAQQRQVMELRNHILASSLDIISMMAMGRTLSDISPQATDLISEMLHLGGVFNVGDFIPWLARFDVQGYERRMKLVGQRWHVALQEVLDLRRAALESKPKGDGRSEAAPVIDLLDVLLSMSDLSDGSVRGVLGDMFIGGTETQSITTEWALAELMANPAKMGTLQAELDKVVGRKRLVQEEDIGNLPYLQAVVKEAMRLHPVAPLLIPHEVTQACEVSGYMIPAKTRVLVNVWAIGRDASVWDNPLQFQPEKFMPEGKYHHVNAHGQHFQLLPFGSGRRQCPAVTLGLLSVHMALANLVQAFDWALPPSTRGVDLSEIFGLSLTMASPLAIIPTPRLDASLYVMETSNLP